MAHGQILKAMSREVYCKMAQTTLLTAIMFITLTLSVCSSIAFGSDQLQQSFISPPPSARPWVYWFWVNGNITKEGITADLEAMQKVGIGGTLIMHVGAGIPAGPVKFFSDEWRDLFKYAVSEADRLGLEVTMNACDGWTGTGGPWIKPEESMMHLTWTETIVEGPSSTPITLKKPHVNLDVYHDIAVLAFPVPAAEAESTLLKPRITSDSGSNDLTKLSDGNINNIIAVGSTKAQSWIQFEFEKPFIARGIRFNIPSKTSKGLPASATIEYSQDGQHFTKLCDLNLKRLSDILSVTFSFDETKAPYYRVILPPTKSTLSEITLLNEARINNWELKAGFARRWGHGADMPYFAMHKSAVDSYASLADPSWTDKEKSLALDRAAIKNLSGNLSNPDTLEWQVPAGKWVILRVGYTPTGEKNGPASIEGTGLEPDALNPNGINIAFSRFMGKLLSDVGPLAGKSLQYCHIDSWETGSQNWTANFQREFLDRRGYDITPYLPVMAGGRVVDSVAVSERFLWDVRRTIADMLAEYYYGQMSKVCHDNGIKFQTEAAGASQFLYDPITFQSRGDLPMGEFWVTEDRVRADCKAAASAAHIFDKQFVGAESFTSAPSTSRWAEHPYSLKALGDDAFCVGVNRYVFHRYAMQPWLNVKPGMTMGKWGIHFERTNTWWDQGASWMSYIARCQSLLQQGRFVADVLYLSGEGAPNYVFGNRSEMTPPLPSGYDFDACNADVLLNMVSVKNGRLVLPNGNEYFVLLLPDETAMSPRLLKKIHELVEAGAVVIGPRPLSSPSLSGYPACDKDVDSTASALWGNAKSQTKERKVGRGRTFRDLPFGEIFTKLSIAPDFEHSMPEGKSVGYIHRRNDQADWYFVSNQTYLPLETTCAFRVTGRQPELWNPETGEIITPAVFNENEGRTLLPLRLEPAGSVFVVFREKSLSPSLQIVKCNNNVIIDSALAAKPLEKLTGTAAIHDFGTTPAILYPDIKNSFTIAFWAKPTVSINLFAKHDEELADREGQQFIVFPEQGEIAYGKGHASAGISVGSNGICVFEHSSSYFSARLVYKTQIKDWTHIALVYDQNRPSLHINGLKVAASEKSRYTVHPCGTNKSPGSHAVAVHNLLILPESLTANKIALLSQSTAAEFKDSPNIEIVRDADETLQATIWQSGKYTGILADGSEISIAAADVAEPLQIKGPWEIRFTDMRAPESTVIDDLISWTELQNPAIKYYSGTAAYLKTIDLPASTFAEDRRLYLDLGNVQVIAEVKVNDKDYGVLWKPPFRLDITDALHPGKNNLEIKVTNQWTNRLIGDEQFPPDAKYSDGRLVEWPQWLIKGEPRPQPQRLTFASWQHYNKQSQLLESGLLGPVVIRSVQVVNLPLPKDSK